MRPILSLALVAPALAASAALAVPAFAAEPLAVPIDQSVRVDVGGFVNSVVIANPGVVDVRVVDSHTFYLMGNGYGATNVVALDRDGRSVYSGDVVVSPPSTGRVSVYRGSARTDMACASSCQVAMRNGSSGGGGGGGGGGASSGGGGISAAVGSIMGGGGAPSGTP
jgi:Flp pilus assembly secretin CpaC